MANMFIKWLKASNEIHLNEKVIEKYQITSKKLIVKYGALEQEMSVIQNNKISEDDIGLSKSFAQKYTIPVQIPYEMILDDSTLKIGPIITFIPTTKLTRLTSAALKAHEKRLSHFENIKGLFVITAANGINIKKQTIRGYYYNPVSKNSRAKWLKGIFPYPDVLYQRRRLNKKAYKDIVAKTGERMINSYLFNKQEMWDNISKDVSSRQYLPYTEHFQSWEQIKQLLIDYPNLYLKPIDGSHGNGIIRIEKTGNDTVTFINRNLKKTYIKNEKEAQEFLKEMVRKPYLIQQGVQAKHNGNHLDFRAYLQKNNLSDWQVQGIIARVAQKDSIVTNLAFVEKLLMWDDACEQVFKIDPIEAHILFKQVEQACITVCGAIDKFLGTFGDVAVDLIIDENFNIFILEINKAYTVKSLKLLNQHELLHTLLTTPLKYAKLLAGF